MSNLHRHPHTVRFGECDPAGIVYFPVFFDWFHQAMESWFDNALGLPYAELLKRYGFPAVKTGATFRRPCAMGAPIVVELRVERLGSSSFILGYRVVGEDGVLRATGQTTCAMIGNVPGTDDHFRAVRIPQDLRDRIQRFMGGPDGQPGNG